MLPCLIFSNIRYVSRVKWSNPGKGVALFLIPRCCSYRKGSLLVALDYDRQLYLQFNNINIEQYYWILYHHYYYRIVWVKTIIIDFCSNWLLSIIYVLLKILLNCIFILASYHVYVSLLTVFICSLIFVPCLFSVLYELDSRGAKWFSSSEMRSAIQVQILDETIYV